MAGFLSENRAFLTTATSCFRTLLEILYHCGVNKECHFKGLLNGFYQTETRVSHWTTALLSRPMTRSANPDQTFNFGF
ncbi:hypothetical protein RRG08_058931 [Elysia crispata]|uniref:Uncharacterized protein n=1 Tax=Elysia crispata TaxID=231223 RepID=A0AAE1CLD1_9GAST|nr:hypothetical protein RRG08_058931 [Elysia crispata]